MAKLNIITLGSSKNYTDLAAFGLTNVVVNDQDKTISFTLVADGSTRTLHFDQPSDGKDGQDGISITGVNDLGNGKFTLLLSDGSETDPIQTVKGQKGDKGDKLTFNDLTDAEKESLKGADGFSPTITENVGNTDKIYKLDITTADSTFTTPNLKGKDGQGGIGGSSTLSADITSNVEVGGVPSGTNFVEGTNLEDIIKKILVKYLPPTATFTITPSNTLKLFGDTITSETMKVVVTKKSNDITEISFKSDSTVLNSITSGVNNGGTFSYTYTPSTPISNTVTLSVDVKDGEQTVTKSIKITFCYPTYYGTVADSVASMTASDIQGLDKRVAVNNKAMTWSGISMDYGKLCYAYPKSFGALTSIKDANNVDYINSYTRTEVTLTENGNSVVYYCYLLTDAAGVSNFKQIYA